MKYNSSPNRAIKIKRENNSSPWTVLNVFGIFLSFIWFLAVLKIFLLEYHAVEAPRPLKTLVEIGRFQSNEGKVPGKPSLSTESYASHERSLKHNPPTTDLVLPSFNEWQFIRSPDKDYYVPNKNSAIKIVTNSNEQSNDILKPWELQWPPVFPGYVIPPKDGYDKMPYSGLKVPRFWKPKEGDDILKVGTKVNGHETIFLMIASYRDFQCRETIATAFSRADHPERLYVGCLDLEVPCTADDKRPICIYKDHISIYKMDASTATGPVTARHIGDRLYRGQYFVMQMDAHCPFTNHWDTSIIGQWLETGNEMAVLSSYLTDVQGSIDENGDSTRNTRPIMCNSDYEGAPPARYLRHGGQPEEVPVIKDMPQLEPYWAAGFSFSRGHFKIQVPYDAYMPMVFQGEEINIGIRAFTFGYDFYAQRESVVFHEYADMSSRRKKIHMFWENTDRHAGEGQKSLKRATYIIGMAPASLDKTSFDHTEENVYGIGKVRSLDLFYKLFLIDRQARKTTQICPFVRSGKMHRDFQKHLRPDGLGIDYSKLENYDTKEVIKNLKW